MTPGVGTYDGYDQRYQVYGLFVLTTCGDMFKVRPRLRNDGLEGVNKTGADPSGCPPGTPL